MKKFLLIATVAVTALTVNAQGLTNEVKMQKVKMPQTHVFQQQTMASKNEAAKAPARMAVDGLWYARPEGAMCYGFGLDGMGYYNCYMVVTPYKDFELRNQCTDPTKALWYWGEEDVTEDFANEDNNFVLSIEGASGYYTPAIRVGHSSFAWGGNNKYGDYRGVMRACSDISPLRFTDPHLCDPSDPSNLKGSDLIGWGYLDSHYLFGDGGMEVTDEDGQPRNLTTFATVQDFEKPMSPLYVENIFISAISLDKKAPLAGDEELTLTILDEEGNELYTLTCTADDLITDDYTEDTDYGKIYYHTAVFSVKELDPLSGEMAAVPFVLDQAFTVMITGFEGTKLGFAGHVNTDEEAAEAEMAIGKYYRGYNYFYDVDDPDYTAAYTFQNTITVPLVFNALFDNAQVWETAYFEDDTVAEDFNVLQFAEDGVTAANAGYPEFGFVMANTATSWYDEDENDQYYLADLADECPDWIVAYGVDNSGWEDYDPETEGPDPRVALALECDPLPEGVSGRGAKLYIYGRGIHSEAPIYVLQGDCTKEQCDAEEVETGITSVVSSTRMNGKTYNLAGQQVGKNFKGIAIKNGKKFIQK